MVPIVFNNYSYDEKSDILQKLYIPQLEKIHQITFPHVNLPDLIRAIDKSAGMRFIIDIVQQIFVYMKLHHYLSSLEEILNIPTILLHKISDAQPTVRMIPGDIYALSVYLGQGAIITWRFSCKQYLESNLDIEIDVLNETGASTKRSIKVSSIVISSILNGWYKGKYKISYMSYPGHIGVDGDSAGVVLFIGMMCYFFKYTFPRHLLGTGAVMNSGDICAVGGIKQKLEAVYYDTQRDKYVLLPAANK